MSKRVLQDLGESLQSLCLGLGGLCNPFGYDFRFDWSLHCDVSIKPFKTFGSGSNRFRTWYVIVLVDKHSSKSPLDFASPQVCNRLSCRFHDLWGPFSKSQAVSLENSLHN